MSIVLPDVLSAFSAQEEEVMRDTAVVVSTMGCHSTAGFTLTLVVPVSTSMALERTDGSPIQ